MLQEVDRKLQQLIGAFSEILYEDDEIFMENMRRKKNLPEEELQKYAHWEWTQGVGPVSYTHLPDIYYPSQHHWFVHCGHWRADLSTWLLWKAYIEAYYNMYFQIKRLYVRFYQYGVFAGCRSPYRITSLHDAGQ